MDKNDPSSISIQLYFIAFYNTLFPDQKSQHRALARWFCHNFNTSYSEAFLMHTEELLLHKFEWQLQELTDKEVKKALRIFLNEKKEAVKEEKRVNEDEAWHKEQEVKYLKEQEDKLKEAEQILKNIKPKEVPPEIEAPPDIKKNFF